MEAPWQEIKRQVMDGLDMSREFTDEELGILKRDGKEDPCCGASFHSQ